MDKLSQARDVGSLSDRGRLQNRIAGYFVVILGEVTDERYRDEVQHDRIDHFMRSKLRLQHSRYRCPGGADKNRSHTTKRHKQPGRQVCKRDSHPCCGKGCDIKLSFGADVKETAAESDEYCKASEDQWRRVEERVANTVWP